MRDTAMHERLSLKTRESAGSPHTVNWGVDLVHCSAGRTRLDRTQRSKMGQSASYTTKVVAGSVSQAKFLQPYIISRPVHEYTMKWGFDEDPIVAELRLATAKHERAVMMGDPVEAALFHLLLPAIGAKRVIEVGVFTGYTTLVMAQALPEDGAVVALDVSEEYAALGKPHWKKAGVNHKIDLRIGPALESLERMIDNGEAGTYDFAFIDADKTNYKGYYESTLKLLRPNGMIAIDNVLWSGKVTDASINDDATVALRDIARHVSHDDRVEHVMLPMADGILLARKKQNK